MQFKKILIILCILIFCNKSFEHFDNSNNVVYLFWTGGFDSTYRLCELLLIENKSVQPIYLTYNLDNLSYNKMWVRRNRKQERIAMNKIIKLIKEKNPDIKLYNRLRPIIYINRPTLKKEFVQRFNSLVLFPQKRRIHQYSHLAYEAYNRNKKIEIGVLGIHNQSNFYKFLKKHVSPENGFEIYDIDDRNPMKNLVFPLFERSKEQLYDTAVKYEFTDILAITWSCWFPTKDGNPCGLCPMCKERIIKHPVFEKLLEHFNQ